MSGFGTSYVGPLIFACLAVICGAWFAYESHRLHRACGCLCRRCVRRKLRPYERELHDIEVPR